MKHPIRNATSFSRRNFLTVAGAAGVALAPLLGGADGANAATARATTATRPTGGNPVTTPVVNGLHLQFGADASSEVVVSWHTNRLDPAASAGLVKQLSRPHINSVCVKKPLSAELELGFVDSQGFDPVVES